MTTYFPLQTLLLQKSFFFQNMLKIVFKTSFKNNKNSLQKMYLFQTFLSKKIKRKKN